MPLDMSGVNSIIQGYISGVQLRQQREKTALDKKQEEDRIKYQKEKDLNDLKEKHDEFKALRDAQEKLDAIDIFHKRNEILSNANKTGEIPSDSTKVSEDDNYVHITNPLLSNGPISIPKAAYLNKLAADKETALNVPKLQETIDKSKVDTASKIEVQKSEDLSKAVEEQLKRDNDNIQKEKERQKDLEVARINAANSGNNPAKAKALHDATELNDTELRTYGTKDGPLPRGTTYKMIEGRTPGTVLTDVQNKKVTMLTTINKLVSQADEILSGKDKPDDKTDNYDKYYVGTVSGTARKLFNPNGTNDPVLEKAHQLLESIQTLAKSAIGEMGGALAGNEQKMLENLAAGPAYTLSSAKGRALIQGTKLLTNEMIKGVYDAAEGKVIPKNIPAGNLDPRTKMSEPRIIQFGKDGKRVTP